MKPKKFKKQTKSYKIRAEIHPDGTGFYIVSEKNKEHWGDNHWHNKKFQENGSIYDWLGWVRAEIREQEVLLELLEECEANFKDHGDNT